MMSVVRGPYLISKSGTTVHDRAYRFGQGGYRAMSWCGSTSLHKGATSVSADEALEAINNGAKRCTRCFHVNQLGRE